MPDSWIPSWSPFGSLKLRTYNKGIEGHEQLVIPTTKRKISAQVMAATFRIAGLASADHDSLRWENASGSTILMACRELYVMIDTTAALATLSPAANVYKVTSSLATGGTASTKHTFDSADTSSSSAVFAGAASADGTASAITWTTASGTPGWSQVLSRQQTAAGGYFNYQFSLLPEACKTDPIILRAAEQIVVSINITAATTYHYRYVGMWDEFTLP